jgi:hypothetical protein
MPPLPGQFMPVSFHGTINKEADPNYADHQIKNIQFKTDYHGQQRSYYAQAKKYAAENLFLNAFVRRNHSTKPRTNAL